MHVYSLTWFTDHGLLHKRAKGLSPEDCWNQIHNRHNGNKADEVADHRNNVFIPSIHGGLIKKES